MKTVPHRLLLAYRGEDFFGWQRQDPDPTVQLALEKALQKIFNHPVAVAGSGRTDRGVHALGQVASCEIPPLHPPATLAKALNFHLPAGVRVLSVRRQKPGFHARFSAKGKSYLYRIANADPLHPLEIGRAWHVPRPLDLTSPQQVALIAPRPLQIQVGLTDKAAPLESVRRAIAEAKVHHPTVDYQEFNGGHEWRGDLAWNFLSKHL